MWVANTKWRHDRENKDIQDNDTQQNDIQYNIIQNKGILQNNWILNSAQH